MHFSKNELKMSMEIDIFSFEIDPSLDKDTEMPSSLTENDQGCPNITGNQGGCTLEIPDLIKLRSEDAAVFECKMPIVVSKKGRFLKKL